MARRKNRKSREEKRGRKFLAALFLRVSILILTGVVILVVGYYRFGWRPLGPKIHAYQIGKSAEIPVAGQDNAILPDESDLEAAISKALYETIETPTPAATPAGITEEDNKAMEDFLKDIP